LTESLFLTTGRHKVQLDFPGKYIRLSRVDPPYMLSQLWLTDIINPTPEELFVGTLDAAKSLRLSTP